MLFNDSRMQPRVSENAHLGEEENINPTQSSAWKKKIKTDIMAENLKRLDISVEVVEKRSGM